MVKKLIITVSAFAAVVFLLGAVKTAQIKESSSQSHQMPPTAVTSFTARMENWHPTVEAIGTLAPVQGVWISADAEGTVQEIVVENGAAVKAGDLLIKLDASVEVAQLQATEAELELARLESDRANELLGKNTISQSEHDQANARLNQARANVAAIKAQIAKKYIHAPFDGRVGIREVNLGQYVSRGMHLLPLHRLDTLHVDFNVPQRQLSLIGVGHKVSITADAFGERVFEGRLAAINPQVNPTTRNVAAQAVIANPKEELHPGMFVRVVVELPETQSLVIVPATAISYAAYGNSVFIIEKMKGPDGGEYLGARQQFVKLGDRRGDMVAILEGLKPGAVVASAGVFKLRNSSPVQINNQVLPSAKLDPKPDNT